MLGGHSDSQETLVLSRGCFQPFKDGLLSVPSAWLATAENRKDLQDRLQLCFRKAAYSALGTVVLLTCFFFGGGGHRAFGHSNAIGHLHKNVHLILEVSWSP